MRAVRKVYDGDPLARDPRTARQKAQARSAALGTQTHTISLRSTAQPRAVKKAPTPMGATLIGRHGKKSRVLSNGAKSAQPKPPFVHMSNNGWLTVAKLMSTHANHDDLRKNDHVSNAPQRTPKAMLCVKPRCPQKLSYGTPAMWPMASKSGTIALKAATSGNFQRYACGTAVRARAKPATTWVKMLGMQVG